MPDDILTRSWLATSLRRDEPVCADIELIEPGDSDGSKSGVVPTWVTINGTSFHTRLDAPIEVSKVGTDDFVYVTVTLVAGSLTIRKGRD